MTNAPATDLPLTDLAEDFAHREIASRRRELISATTFPEDLWQAFAKSGLAGLTVPTEYGGAGAGFETVSDIGQILNRVGGVPGVAMVFMTHWQLTKLHIVGDAPEAIKRALLPELAAGSATLSIAISEPEAGAHPKFLKTSARREGDMFVLSGEKAYLTNGPLARYFIVLAITSEADSRKQFSALLVPADSPGLRQTKGVEIDFLHPCPHGGLKMDNCRIPQDNLIGTEGEAFARTSLRMRAIEDAVGAASHVGSMYRLLNDIAALAPADEAAELGKAATMLRALEVTSRTLAALADNAGADLQPLLELQLGHRQQTHACALLLDALLGKCSSTPPEETTLLNRDILKYHSIAGSAHKARLAKIGQSLIQSIGR